MNINHLSTWEQEEYVLGQRSPEMLRHLTECMECRTAVGRLEHGVARFRSAAVEWSSECLAVRPQRSTIAARRFPMLAARWTIAAALPVLLLVLMLLSLRPSTPPPARHTAAMSDDALLDQVDEQLSVAVPSSMESLTHLVSSGSGKGSNTAVSTRESEAIVQTN